MSFIGLILVRKLLSFREISSEDVKTVLQRKTHLQGTIRTFSGKERKTALDFMESVLYIINFTFKTKLRL